MRISKLGKELQEAIHSKPEDWRERIAHEPSHGDGPIEFALYLAAIRYWKELDPRGYFRGYPSTEIEIQEYWTQRRARARPSVLVCTTEYPRTSGPEGTETSRQ